MGVRLTNVTHRVTLEAELHMSFCSGHVARWAFVRQNVSHCVRKSVRAQLAPESRCHKNHNYSHLNFNNHADILWSKTDLLSQRPFLPGGGENPSET